MSAEVQWSVVRKGNTKYTKKNNGTVFSWNSVDNLHKATTAVIARRRGVDVIKGKLHKTTDGKKTVHRFSAKRADKLLSGFRGDVANKVAKKVRYQKRAASSKASKIATKKEKKVKA